VSAPAAIAEKLAKLLRLACSNGPDGEKLAALGRLAALAAAHDVDWDAALANGGLPALTREQLQEVFDAGYERGLSDGRAEVQPRDWTLAGGTSTAAGHDIWRVKKILEAAQTAQRFCALNDFEQQFTSSIRSRVMKYGSRTYFSEKQWEVLDRLAEKLDRGGWL
jgi:hypothetical protein